MNRLPDGCWLVLPVQCTEPELHGIRRAAETAKLGGVVAQSMGQVSLADHWPVFFGDAPPVTNRRALEAPEGSCPSAASPCGRRSGRSRSSGS
ncbi:MAG: hypothetical protein ACLUE8_03175 [Lachnospiraceae bacterium]